ncbi:hypothetical protein LTR66_013628 [Elasticomyces elasticus]|nr:hypothetical protein LTR66_013628 [Elasticomyces elasticus]
MLLPSHSSYSAPLPSSQPAARHRPRSPTDVLAEAEAQWIYTEEELAHTPSVQDGMAPEKERELRWKGVNFIQQVGIMLKLPQLTLSTAAVFFNRYLMRHSLVDAPGMKALHHYQIGATALFLATKVEESCRKMRELIVSCCRVAQKNPNLVIDEQSKDYWRWRDTILQHEDILLEALCFDLTIEAPHKTLFELLKYYGVEHNKNLRNAAWAFVTDSNSTQLCLLARSRTIAAAALYAAAKYCDVEFPDENGRAWWDVQRVRLRDLRRSCNYMVDCYENPPNKPAGGAGNTGGESIYVGLRTPESGARERTRSVLTDSQGLRSPSMGSFGGHTERRGSEGSVGSKRGRPDGDASRDEREAKRSRHETNGYSAGVSLAPGLPNGTASPAAPPAQSAPLDKTGAPAVEDKEDVSEEGEVEE